LSCCAPGIGEFSLCLRKIVFAGKASIGT
jgi:hypothetical protein